MRRPQGTGRGCPERAWKGHWMGKEPAGRKGREESVPRERDGLQEVPEEGEGWDFLQEIRRGQQIKHEKQRLEWNETRSERPGRAALQTCAGATDGQHARA